MLLRRERGEAARGPKRSDNQYPDRGSAGTGGFQEKPEVLCADSRLTDRGGAQGTEAGSNFSPMEI